MVSFYQTKKLSLNFCNRPSGTQNTGIICMMRPVHASLVANNFHGLSVHCNALNSSRVKLSKVENDVQYFITIRCNTMT